MPPHNAATSERHVVRRVLNRVLGHRSVAAWQVTSGVCAVIALVVSCVGLRTATKDEPLRSPAVTSPHAAGGGATPTAPFRARETRYLKDIGPVDESGYGKWRAASATIGTVVYPHAVRVSGCSGEVLTRSYLTKREYRRFRAEVGVADDSPDVADIVVRVLGDNDVVLYSGTAGPAQPSSIDIDVSDVIRLTLETKDWCARDPLIVVWGDARLER